MYGQCKNCENLFNCLKPQKWGCGFCETNFQPKARTQAKPTETAATAKSMRWVQKSATQWEAVGKDGTFYIERSRGLFWGRYVSKSKTFKLKPKKKLSEAKAFCEDNFYWEGAT